VAEVCLGRGEAEAKSLAQRFALYVRAAGAVPVTMEHIDHRKHAVALQQQYQRLIDEHGRERVNQARIAARAEIRKVTLEVAAHGLIPGIPPIPTKSKKKTRRAKALTPITSSSTPARAVLQHDAEISKNLVLVGPKSRDIRKCQHKLAHFDYLSALHHARRLTVHPGEAPIHIYPCFVRGGLHIGHAPKATATLDLWEDWEPDAQYPGSVTMAASDLSAG
jgi:hypothetical protein